MKAIYTIGYEGAQIEGFLAALKSTGVKHVLDVRDRPISRKQGFSKTALSGHLANASIAYTHLQALGDPKPGREAMRAGRVKDFEAIFTAHLRRPEATEALETASRLVADSPSALLCFECEARCCHRSIIAERVARRTAFRVLHLDIRALIDGPQRRGTAAYAVW